MFEKFLTTNTPGMKLLRTIVQGVIGVVIAALPDLVGLAHLDPAVSGLVVAGTVAVLTPCMATLGQYIEDKNIEVPRG